MTYRTGGSIFADYTLWYDDGLNTVGNLTGVSEPGSATSFGYDSLYRLTAETRTGSGAYSRGYQLDLAGNRLQGEGVTCTFDSANKVSTLSGGSVSYDADGNLTSRYATGLPSLWLSWNDLSQVTQLGGGSSVTPGYDGLGRRVCATSTTMMSKTFFIFDGDLLLGEVQPSMYVAPPGMPQPPPTVTAAYTWGAAGLVSQRRVSAGTSQWYAFGPQGETRQLTSSTGAVVDTYSYTAYGVPLGVTGSDPNPFRFGGQAGYYTDPAASGLVLCGARWYDPYTGRWLSRDPIGYEGGVNLYEYCEGNPVGALDPSGMGPLLSGGLWARFLSDKMVPPGPPGASVDTNIAEILARYRISASVCSRAGDLDGTYAGGADAAVAWLHAVWPKQRWDYKTRARERSALIRRQWEAFGNFNYGATGAALGLPLKILKQGGGFAADGRLLRLCGLRAFFVGPPYGDSAIDQYWIERGFRYYHGPYSATARRRQCKR